MSEEEITGFDNDEHLAPDSDGEGYDPIALLDQMGTEFENLAKIFATYYQTLVLYRVPEDLSKRLLEDLHRMYWANRFIVIFQDTDGTEFIGEQDE